ncbi:MAG: hypothetical protein V1789_06530 [PVC group bacterium]
MTKNAAMMVVIILLFVPSLRAQDAVQETPEPATGVAIGGGIWGRYLHLELQHWKYPDGERLPEQDLFYYGGRVVVCGPLNEAGTMRWRFGGAVGAAGSGDDDVNELNLGMITGGLTSGLSWRPGIIGVSLDLIVGGSAITTEVKRLEEAHDWDLYERRDVALFYWEPMLSFDVQVLENFVIRLQGGYSFLYGKGKEVGGATAGLACDLGQWM